MLNSITAYIKIKKRWSISSTTPKLETQYFKYPKPKSPIINLTAKMQIKIANPAYLQITKIIKININLQTKLKDIST